MKFLTLINAIALLHQYQRPVKTDTRNGETLEYIEATKEDVKLARELVRQVLGPSLDELPAHTRRLLLLVAEMVKQECARLQMECAEYRFTAAHRAAAHACWKATRSCGCICGGWKRWNICWCAEAGRA